MDEEKLKLVEEIIRLHFGPLLTSVCRFIMRKGPATLVEIVSNTKLQPDQVKECLIVAIQHNFVYFVQTRQSEKYHIVLDNLVIRLRFPQFIKLAREKFKKQVRVH